MITKKQNQPMKNKYVKTVLLLLSTCIANIAVSQNLVSTWYTFTTSTSAYSAISGGSVLGTNLNNDDTFNAVPIGFTFNFMGNNYTTVSINANGYLKFGSVLNNYSSYPIGDSFGDDSLVCALGSDLASINTGTATGVLSYTTLGISPNRTFVAQWANYTYNGNTDVLNFQIKLYESTNKIDVIYGNLTLSATFTSEVGLRGNGVLDFNNRSIISGVNTWAASTAGIFNSDYCELSQGPPVFRPASGRKYTWSPPPLCSGTPLAGTLSSLAGTIACIGQALNLNVTGSTFATGLTYQWQSSANGSTWSAVSSATNQGYAPTYTAAPIYYRRVIACGSNTAATTSLNFTTITSITYTSVPFLENFDATWQSRCDLRNVPKSNCWLSNPTTGNNSWRRQDDGVSAAWTNVTAGITPLQGAGCASFNSDDAISGVSGSLDLYVNMGTTQNYDVSFYYSNDLGNDSLEVLLSTNGGGSFVKKAVYKSGDYAPFLTGWNKKVISLLSVSSASCVVRFQATSSTLFSEPINIDSLKIVAIPFCSGTPTAGTLSSVLSTVACIGQSLNLAVNGSSNLSGLTYQWQSSTNGTTWTAVSSATNTGYTLTYTTPIYYRRITACASSTAASNALNFGTVANITYTSVPFLENFNATWQNRCDLRNVPRTTCWSSNPTTGNSSWRRQDDGVSAAWTNTANGIAPWQGAGCADFNSDDATAGVSGALDLYVNMGTTQNYDVSFYYSNDYSDDSLEVLFSTNGGSSFIKQATFKSGDYSPFLTGWNKKTLSLLSVNSSSCVVRFQATSNFNVEHIAIDSLKIVVQPTCIGTPSAGTISSPIGSVVCLGQALNLPVSGGTSGFSGLTYQWQSSTNGTTWTAISSATIPAYSPTYTAPLYYRRVIACGSNTAASNGLNFSTVVGITYTSVPFSENFNGTWQNRCDVRNVPRATCWSSNPTTGNNSWRRQDDGISANWTFTANGIAPSEGTGCADFNSSDAVPGLSGVLDLYVNMGTPQNYTVSFYYNNDCGTDSLEVLLSTNGGSSFVKQVNYKSGDFTPFTGWNKKIISLLSVNSPSCVLRFQASNNSYACDHIAIDSLKIQSFALPCTTPTLALSASSSSICSGSSSSLTVSGATSYTWSTAATTSVVLVSPTVTSIYTVTGSNGVGCNSTRTIQITLNTTPTVAASNATICSGSSTIVTASGATSYTWSTGANSASVSLNPLATNNYTVTGGNASGCLNTKTISVTVNSTPTVAANNATICLGASTVITASGASGYLWNTGVSTASILLSPTITINYTVSGNNAAGCIGSKTIQVTVVSSPTLSAINRTICVGSSTVLTASGAASYTWNTGATTTSISVSPTLTTTYTVNGSNAAGCIASTTVQVIANPIPTVSVNNQTICPGGTATITASGATTYSWSTGSTASSITVAPAINTNYTVTGNSLGCINTKTVSVTVGSALSININSNPISFCLGNTGTLSASGAITYTWNTGFVGTNIVITPTTTTNYTVTGTNGACSGTKTISIVVNPNPTVTATASSSNICVGAASSLTATGALTYTWNPGSFVGSTFSVTPATTTNYTVTGANASGCVNTKTVSITVNNAPTLTVSATPTVICSGQSGTLTASGATTYTWNTGATGASTSVSPSITASYTVNGSNAAGCVGSKTIQVNVNPTPTVSVSNQTICPSSTATLIASGAATYSWNTGATTSLIAVSPTVNTTYTVTGNSSGCSNTRTVSVSISSPVNITITANPTSVCAGNTSTLSASGASTYTWNTGFVGTNLVITPTTTTNYTVTGSNGSCNGTKTISIVVNPSPTVIATSGSSSICAGGTTNLSATGATTYTWNPGNFVGAVFSVTPSITTNYTVVGTNASGCVNTKTVSVTVNNAPTISVNANPATICSGESSTLTASGASSYTWSVGGSGASKTVTPLSTAIYTVSGTSSGCVGNATVVVNVNPTPTVSVNDQTICPGGTATITASGANTYLWDNGSTSASIVDSPSANTIYTVTGTSLGCSDTKTVSVTIGGFISLNITPSPANICVGGSVTLVASGASSYTWNTGDVNSAISVTPNTTTDYTVNGSNGSCTGSQTVTVFVNPNPTLVTTVSSSTICVGGTNSLSVSGANSYTWNPGNFVGSSYSVNPSSTTTYTVVGADVNGCLDSKINTVTVDQLPTAALAGTSQTLCATSTTLNGNVQTTGTGVWSLVSGAGTIASPNQANSTVTGLSVGNNIFQWTISNGVCPPSSSTVSIVGNNSPTVTASSNASIICAGSTATLTASGATTYSWNTGDLTPSIVVNPSVTTTYSVVGDVASVCPSSATVNQPVDPCLSINGISYGNYNITVYPNPFSDDLTVSTNEPVNVQFFNTIGQLVIEKNINKTDVINTGGFAKGIYHVVITGASNTKTFKVIKE
jgi:hypothetical protein